MGIRHRANWDPTVLPGFLLGLSGFGVVLLARSSLTAASFAEGFGKVALAVFLLMLFVRIWRANDGSGFMALLFTILYGIRYFLRVSLRPSAYHSSPLDWDADWFSVIYAVVLLEISVGLWRAHVWARWAAGVACILSSTRFVLMLEGVYPKVGVPPSALSMPGVLALSFALFWAAIAFYLFLPSTGARFAEMRFDRE